MTIRYGTFVLFALAFAGCGKDQPVVDKVTDVAGDDPTMNAAIDKARSTVGQFVEALKSPQPGQSAFAVKAAFEDGDDVEHMWLNPVRFDGTDFQGTVNNEPQKVTTVEIGQQVSVAPAEISDWMYVENGKLVGGYTLRVLRDSLTPDERADFDKNVPFVVE